MFSRFRERVTSKKVKIQGYAMSDQQRYGSSAVKHKPVTGEGELFKYNLLGDRQSIQFKYTHGLMLFC